MTEAAAIIELPPAAKKPKRHRHRMKFARYSDDEAAELLKIKTKEA